MNIDKNLSYLVESIKARTELDMAIKHYSRLVNRCKSDKENVQNKYLMFPLDSPVRELIQLVEKVNEQK